MFSELSAVWKVPSPTRAKHFRHFTAKSLGLKYDGKEHGSLLSWWHESFIWEISVPWDCRGRRSGYLFLLLLDHCSGSVDDASITPCKGWHSLSPLLGHWLQETLLALDHEAPPGSHVPGRNPVMGTFSASSVFSLIIFSENLECLKNMRDGTGTQEVLVLYLLEASLLFLYQAQEWKQWFWAAHG